MMSSRRHAMLVVRGAAGVLAAVTSMAADVAIASPLSGPAEGAPSALLAFAGGPDSCGDNGHVSEQGGSSGTVAKVCQGSGPVYIGSAVGQWTTVAGPTVTGPGQVNAVVTAGDGIMGY